MAPLSRVVDAFLKGSLEVRHRFGATSEPHARAKVISTSLAGPTVVTRYTNFQCDPVANLEPVYGFPDSDDDTCRLMPKGKRHHGLEIAVAEFIVIRYIASTHSSSLDSDLEFMRRGI